MVQFFEAAPVHVNLAARFENFRGRATQPLGHRSNGANVLSDVVADHPIPTRGRVSQFSVFVEKRNGHAVYFWLDYDWNLFVRQKARDAPVKIGDFRFGISVVETEHRQAMLDLSEGFEGLATDALGWRIGCDKLRKSGFKIEKFPVEPVVFTVANYRRGFFIIMAVVLFDFATQLFDSLARRSLRFCHKV